MPRSNAAMSKRVLGRIQRLCCLGLPSETIVPEVMRELDALVPMRWGCFRWRDRNWKVTNVYNYFSAGEVELYMAEFLNDDCNLLVRPSRADAWLVMRVLQVARPLGAMTVGRAAHDAPFSPGDRQVLHAIADFVAHAMTRATVREDAFVDNADCALLVADPDGRVRHAGAQARRLLLLALVPQLSLATDSRAITEPIAELAWLCRNLAAAANGEAGQPPPVLRRRNVWGQFILRAYWLGPTDGEAPTRQVGITVERRVPRTLALWRRVEELPLTAREKQLSVLLTRDLTRDGVAREMGLSATTVMTHQRSIYAKLGVHSRAGLIASLQPG